MGEAVLLKEEQLEVIAFVKEHLVDWLKNANEEVPKRNEWTFLGERMVRVEESIKHQGDLIEKILHQIDKRFEQVDKRFEQVDKRFEELRADMNTRFEELRADMNTRFEELRTDMNKRFNQMFAYLTTGIVILGILVAISPILGG